VSWQFAKRDAADIMHRLKLKPNLTGTCVVMFHFPAKLSPQYANMVLCAVGRELTKRGAQVRVADTSQVKEG
jgi:fatty acid-binding protein DegV